LLGPGTVQLPIIFIEFRYCFE